MLSTFLKKVVPVTLMFTFSFYGLFFSLAQKTYAVDFDPTGMIGSPQDMVSNMAPGIASVLITPDKIADTAPTIAAVGSLNAALANQANPLKVSDVLTGTATYWMALSMMGVGPEGTPAGAPPGTAKKTGWWDRLGVFVIKFVLRQFTLATVNWINSGFQGNPAYIQDPNKFMMQATDRAIGEFIFQGPLNWLCDPFKIKIQLALGLQYRPFQDKINCSLSGILNNVQGAYNGFVAGNFIDGGGWDSWLQLTTQPQNNEIGAMLMSQAELDARIEGTTNTNLVEAGWAGGLLSFKKCTEQITVQYKDSDGKIQGNPIRGEGETYYGSPVFSTKDLSNSTSTTNQRTNSGSERKQTVTNCTTETPGSVFQTALGQVAGMDLNQLGVADDINEIVNALANYTLKQIMQKTGFGGVKDNVDTSQSGWQQQLSQWNSQNYPVQTSSNIGNTSGNQYPYTQSALNQFTNIYQPQNTELSTLLQSKLDSENSAKSIYDEILAMLTSADTAFTSVASCSYGFPTNATPDSSLPARVVKNIEGTISSPDQIIPSGIYPKIPIDIPVARQVIASSTEVVGRLQNVQSGISGYSSTQVTDEISLINADTTSFHDADTASSTKASLKDWLNGVAGTYSTTACPIATSTWQ